MQLQNARHEIHRAQDLLDTVEAQRVEAEEEAAKLRSDVRKLKQERIIQLAREEGRRQGYEEGLVQGRAIGFEEGRASRYSRGHKTRASDPSETPDEASGGDESPPSGPSAPSFQESEPRNTDSYTQPLDNNLPIPPPVTTPASKDYDTRPISVYNVLTSPSHPPVDYPPDGWIPKMDEDMRIRLPPQHELGPPPPVSPPPGVILSKDMAEERPAIMIPPPAVDHGDSALVSDTDSLTTPVGRYPRHRRRGSSESQSTTLSQFEMLAPLNNATRNVVRERPSVLSAISEERERSSSMSSPTHSYAATSSPSFQMPLARPSPPAHHIHLSDDLPHPRDIYMRPRSSQSSLNTGYIAAPTPSSMPVPQARSNRGSMSSNEGIPITIVPPSRPESNLSRISAEHTLLSANDVPPSPQSQAQISPQTSVQPPPPVIPPTASIPVSLEQLPPGFVPSGPPQPSGPFTPQAVQPSMLNRITPQSIYRNGSSPAGVPLPSSSYAGTPSIRSDAIPGTFPTSEPPVIPLLPSSAGSQTGLASARGPYSRSRAKGSSSDSDDAVSSRMSDSMDSLTTPPARTRKLSGRSTPAYDVAPLTPGVSYSMIPPTPRSTTSMSSHATRAARVPLPPSTSTSAASLPMNAAYPYAPTPFNRSTPALDAGRPPSAMERPRSPFIGSGRNLASPSPSPAPLPIHVPQVVQMPSPEVRNIALNDDSMRSVIDMEPVPVVSASTRMSRTASPGSSTLTSVTAASATTSKSKKAKKKGKKSKIASVEEVPDEEE
ncbi:hypothetical protein A0H81_09788 [Grifola frondosa]|uniref:Uncharacterized protein n=1 Tax=Grifola frondosa TaxID=5627 RepID=A0A1C7M0S1_GRIFR|nr:hypothetical protein A0H81_09788 [Grifola frondosa]